MKKTFNNLFTLIISALLVINMIPGNVFAEEEDNQLPAEVPVEVTQENVQEEVSEPVVQIEEDKEETPALTEEKKEEVKEENKEENKEAVQIEEAPLMMSVSMEAMGSMAEAVEETAVKQEKIKITVNFVDIMTTSGTTKTGTASSTLSKSVSSWRILAAKFKNQIPSTDFSVQGTKYHFTGEWAYEDGSIVSIPMEFKYDDFNEDTTINIHPIYEITEAARLNFYKIDNISYGSGSWANTAGTFTTYTNTLKAPSAKAHYQFLYWQDEETGKIYNAGDKFSIKASDIGDGNTKDVRLYAMWQPSLTLRYHDLNGKVTSTKEAFESLSVYAQSAASVSGYTFKGWSLTPNGAVLGSDASYSIPSITHEKVEQMIVDLYPVYSTSYEVEHYIEGLDGNYTLKDHERIEDVALNASVSAEVRSYEGFSFASGNTNGTAKAGLVFKLYYSRNSYTVSYEYGNVPANALVLPESKTYRYEEAVKISAVPAAEGYSFLGWDKEDFTMPAHDVTVTGSFAINSYKVNYEYENAPENAPALPEMKEYEYRSDVKVAEAAQLEGYTFSGWDKEDFTMPAEDVVIKGSYEINRYSVRFLNDDGSLLELDEEVAYGTMASYDGSTPVKKSDGIYTYTFAGWSEELKEVKEDQVYTARFKAELIPVVTEEIPEGGEPQAPSSPINIDVPEEPEIEIAETLSPLAEPETTVEEQQIIAEVMIDEESVPQAQFKTWALYNLIAMIVTVLTGLFMVLSFFRNNKEEEEQEEENNEEQEKTGRRYSKFLGLIPMIASIIAFILTEDMRNLMVLKDRFTIPMIVIALFELVLAVITRNRKKEEKEEEEELLLIEA
ncbi:MAG: InlB B-repeat-containing protein [Erysipelotrichaceae bacterium]|nr:InlB B-repeat-containing protein [Erysipelotrichaceae bacterium]